MLQMKLLVYPQTLFFLIILYFKGGIVVLIEPLQYSVSTPSVDLPKVKLFSSDINLQWNY